MHRDLPTGSLTCKARLRSSSHRCYSVHLAFPVVLPSARSPRLFCTGPKHLVLPAGLSPHRPSAAVPIITLLMSACTAYGQFLAVTARALVVRRASSRSERTARPGDAAAVRRSQQTSGPVRSMFAIVQSRMVIDVLVDRVRDRPASQYDRTH